MWLKPQDTLGGNKRHMQDAGYLREEQEKRVQGVNRETSVVSVIFLF